MSVPTKLRDGAIGIKHRQLDSDKEDFGYQWARTCGGKE